IIAPHPPTSHLFPYTTLFRSATCSSISPASTSRGAAGTGRRRSRCTAAAAPHRSRSTGTASRWRRSGATRSTSTRPVFRSAQWSAWTSSCCPPRSRCISSHRNTARQRRDGLGWRVTATLGASGISHDTLIARRNVSGAALEVSQTWRNAGLAGTARLGAAGLPQQFEGRAGWIPIRPFTLAGTVRQSVYRGHRGGVRAFGTAGLTLPLGFSARAEVAWQHDAQAPLVTTDRVQRAFDIAGWIGLEN